MEFYSVGESNVGLLREVNEDAFYCNDSRLIYCVIDGMGGEKGGKIAAEFIAKEFQDSTLADAAKLKDLMLFTHNRLLRKVSESNNPMRFGATVVALAMNKEGLAYINWAGDCRAYVYREGTLTLLTKDHSYVQQLIDTGKITAEEGYAHPHRNLITRAVGIYEENWTSDEVVFQCKAGDRFLLCSDGLTNEVSEKEIQTSFAEFTNNQEFVSHLIDSALKHGARDNVTVLTICIATNPEDLLEIL